MDLVLGQAPAVAAAASAAEAAASATAAANSALDAAGSATAAAASVVSIGFMPGPTVVNNAGKLEWRMPIRFGGANYNVTATDHGYMLAVTAGPINFPVASAVPADFICALRNAAGINLTVNFGSYALKPEDPIAPGQFPFLEADVGVTELTGAGRKVETVREAASLVIGARNLWQVAGAQIRAQRLSAKAAITAAATDAEAFEIYRSVWAENLRL